MKLVLNNEQSLEVNLISISDNKLIFECDGKKVAYDYVQKDQSFFMKNADCISKVSTLVTNDLVEINHEGKYYQVKLAKSNSANAADESVHQTEYGSPMPGKISKITVSVGQKVKKGDVLVYLEAMKMEHPVKAKMEGVVEIVSATIGQQVDQGQILIKLKIV